MICSIFHTCYSGPTLLCWQLYLLGFENNHTTWFIYLFNAYPSSCESLQRYKMRRTFPANHQPDAVARFWSSFQQFEYVFIWLVTNWAKSESFDFSHALVLLLFLLHRYNQSVGSFGLLIATNSWSTGQLLHFSYLPRITFSEDLSVCF